MIPTRPLSEQDNAFLDARERELASYGFSNGEYVSFVIVSSVLAGLAAGLVLWVLSLTGLHDHPNWKPWSQGAIVLVGLVVFSWGLRETVGRDRRILQNAKTTLDKIKADRTAGIVHPIVLNIREVKVFREPEHGGRFLFLRLEDDGVWLLFDHDSQTTTSSKNWIRPHEKMELVRFPNSKLQDYRFSGAALSIPKAKTISLSPKHWPALDTYCDIPWGDLDAHMMVSR